MGQVSIHYACTVLIIYITKTGIGPRFKTSMWSLRLNLEHSINDL